MPGVFKQPETALLIACARMKMQPQDLDAAAAAIDRRPDWSFFIRAAREHGTIALVHQHLQGSLARNIPAEALDGMRHAAFTQARRNLSLARELVALNGLFAKHEIAMIPLKGPILAQQIYGSIALRRMGDLDLLVKSSDALRAAALLSDRGYVAEAPGKRDADEIRPHTTHELQPMFSKEIGCTVDIHHALVQPIGGTRFTLEEILERTQPTLFMGITFQVLAHEELFVYLCEHGNGHLWDRLEWICSLAELLRCGRIEDWNRSVAFANRLGGRRRLETAIRLAHDLLDAPPPAGLLTKRAAGPAARVIDRYAKDLSRVRTPAAAELFRYQLATDDGFCARADRVWKMVLLPRNSDIESLPLPRPLWLVYYIARPFLIVLRLLRRPWRRTKRNNS